VDDAPIRGAPSLDAGSKVAMIPSPPHSSLARDAAVASTHGAHESIDRLLPLGRVSEARIEGH